MTRTERQILAIDKWRDAGGNNSIVMPTGTGKTRTALMAIDRVTSKNPNLAVRVIVPTKVLQNQWQKLIDQQQWDIDIKILILNTAAKKPFKCDFLIIDELHRSNSLTFRDLFKNCNPALILGLTATYERLDGFEKQVVDHYCPVCDTITIDEATKNGWLAPYKEYRVLLDVDLTEYNKANSEFLQHFSFFNYNFDVAMTAVTSVWEQQKLAKEMKCTLKEVKAHAFAWKNALHFRKSFVANHPKKIEIAKKIIEARSDRKIITFNSSIEQCKSYGSGYIVHSQQSKKKNDEILEEFSHCNSGCIHSSKLLIEGLDCPGLSVGIITGYTSSKTSHTQEIGRTIRFEPGKEAEIFTLVIKGTVEEQWSRKSSEDLNIIEISEQELDSVLNNTNNKFSKKQEKIKNDLLRI